MKCLTNNDIIYIENEDISYIQFKRLLEYPEIIHAYTVDRNINFKTTSNNQKDKNYDIAISNYKKLCNILKMDFNKSIRADLDHTDKIKTIKNIDKANFDITNDKYDGLITNSNNINLITTSADCITFLIYDPVNKVIANIHSGWKGTLKQIVIKAIKMMHDKFNSNYKDIIVCICPSIRKCHFEVDYDVYSLFKKEYDFEDIYEQKGNKWYIDTIKINKILLLELGIQENNIIDSNICTVCNSDVINSYRSHKANFKLNAGVISLKNNL